MRLDAVPLLVVICKIQQLQRQRRPLSPHALAIQPAQRSHDGLFGQNTAGISSLWKKKTITSQKYQSQLHKKMSVYYYIVFWAAGTKNKNPLLHYPSTPPLSSRVVLAAE